MNDATRSALLEYFAEGGDTLAGAVRRIRAIDSAPQLDDETTAQFLNGLALIAREELVGESSEGAYDLYTESAAVAVRSQGRSLGSLANSFAIAAGVIGDEVALQVDASVRSEAVDWVSCFLGKWAEDVFDAYDRVEA